MNKAPQPGTGPLRTGRLAILTLLTMTAFAANPILCRMALKATAIDPATFTVIRLLSGATTLWLIVRVRTGGNAVAGNWRSAFSLFAYAAAFSFAYVSLSAGTGTLILFGTVQATMILYGLLLGERFTLQQTAGLLLALGGLMALLLPGVTAPPWGGAALMATAGIAWGAYSLLGRISVNPIETTAGNFLRASGLGVLLSVVSLGLFAWDARGALLAVLSGTVASGLGYAIWYTVLPALRATHAATVQLSVPVIAALAGVLLLDEHLSPRLVLCSIAILGGIAFVLHARKPERAKRS
ncbi:MAG: DMT family transporter [Steroidobacteraceae bacterium]|nr:DMT family transporter [Steroidobacteraceae bacterium]